MPGEVAAGDSVKTEIALSAPPYAACALCVGDESRNIVGWGEFEVDGWHLCLEHCPEELRAVAALLRVAAG